MGKLVEPLIGALKLIFLACHRKLYRASVRSAVVIENAKEILIRGFAKMGEAFDERRIVCFLCLLRFYAKETAVDEDDAFSVCHKKLKPPLLGAGYMLAYERRG